jgi:hypothetical protein
MMFIQHSGVFQWVVTVKVFLPFGCTHTQKFVEKFETLVDYCILDEEQKQKWWRWLIFIVKL